MIGKIFNIQKYALHDGPGIRTTVFLKGCPLSCLWCHNPESISPDQELSYNESKCILCHKCNGFTEAEVCPTLALEVIGKNYTVDELMIEILKDQVFYEQSHGGVTFSGGEPLLQSEFLLEMLVACKSHGLQTAVDTSGFADWTSFESIKSYVDLFLYDIKHFDSIKHLKMTGVSNTEILKNFKRLIKTNDVFMRVPLIKGFNDEDDFIDALIDLAKYDHVKQINFLPYHGFAENKYKDLKEKNEFHYFEKPTDEWLKKVIKKCERHHIKAKIGG